MKNPAAERVSTVRRGIKPDSQIIFIQVIANSAFIFDSFDLFMTNVYN